MSDIPKFSLQNTATGEYEGFEDDLAFEISNGCTMDEQGKLNSGCYSQNQGSAWKMVRLTWSLPNLPLQMIERKPIISPPILYGRSGTSGK